VWASQTTEPTVTEPVELQLVLPTPERIPEPEMQFNIPNSDWHNQDNTFLDVTEDICKADIAEHTNTDPPALPLARNAILIKLVQLGRKFFSRPRKAKTKRIVTNFSGLWLLILIIRIGVCTLSGEFLGGTLFHRALVGLLVGFFFGLYITFLM
jgi:hypothetical protein